MSVETSRNAQLTEEDMEEFFELTLEMLCVAGFDGYFKRINPTWTRVLGWTEAELLAEPFANFVHPDDREATAEIVREHLAKGEEVFFFKNRYRCKDGSYRLLEWTTAPSKKRQLLCAVARDITGRDREQQRLAHLVKTSRVVLYSLTLDPGGSPRCTFITDNILDQFGHAAAKFMGPGTAWLDHLHPDDVAATLGSYDPLLKNGRLELRYRFRHKDGSYRWVSDQRTLLRDDEGKPIEIVGTWRDITDWVEAEDLIRKQASALTELSTPLIPINEQVVVMPLIGTLDSQRAKQILDTLLVGVSSSRASVAILDITGVSVVDTQVANALLQAAKSVRLLGAKVVLTGIRPHVAQTLVGLGVDLGDIVTRGTLQAGISYAMTQNEGDEAEGWLAQSSRNGGRRA